MKAGTLSAVLVTLVLAGLSLFAAIDVAERFPAARAEVGRVKLSRLSDELRDRLGRLRDDVTITWYVTARDRMPSHMRRVERSVTDLLAAMARESDGRLGFQIVDPTEDEDLARFAARRGVAPVRERHVSRDAFSEQEVWSTLSIAYGPRKPALIQGVGPHHLPRLQELLVRQLDQLEAPRRPVFAVAAPSSGFTALRRYLAEQGTLIEADPGSGAPLPENADVLFWIDPGTVGADALRNLNHFLDTGRSVVVAGSELRASLGDDDGQPALLLEDSGYDVGSLLGAFGLAPVSGLVLDAKSASLPLPTGDTPAPFRLLCLALNQDFHSMAKEPKGSLLMVAPTPIQFEPERLAQLGWKAEVLATTSDQTTLLPTPKGPIRLAALAGTPGEPAAKQTLLLWMRHADPWRGSMVVAAGSDLFRDETFEIRTLAHKRLTGVLADTLASDERLVVGRAGLGRAPPLPVMSSGSRLLWRVLTLFLFPLALLIVAWIRIRNARPWGDRQGERSIRPWKIGLLLRGATGVVAVLILAALCRAVDVRADLTAGGTNELAGRTRELAGEWADAGKVTAELVVSADAQLPPELRPLPGQVRSLLREIDRAGADLTLLRIDPDDLDEAGRERLAGLGVEPFPFTSRTEEVTTVRNVTCSLLLSAADRTERLDLPNAQAAEHLEFRVAFALWRLLTGRTIRVAFASDAPRLSSAEAYQYYQSRGLIPPSGKDVYSVARELLAGCEFQVTHVNPRDPVLPDPLDLLIWIQPRRSVQPMMEAFVEHLYRGGRALLAAQHFNIQSRQYRGTEFEFVYWPQPQSPDVEEFYFPDLGVLLVREVLFDALNTPVELKSQLNRFSRREFRTMNLAKPFLLRTVGEHYDRDSVVTRDLGDQAFLFANYLRLDEQRLAAAGLTARTLITTSEQSWSLDWKGGWIPNGYMEFPPTAIVEPEEEDNDADTGKTTAAVEEPVALLGRLPLAVDLRGSFPWPEKAFVHPPVRFGPNGAERDEPPDYPRAAPVDQAAPGRLLYLGCSEMLKDHRLLTMRPEFRADHLLLNAVADLTLDPGLAEVMARRPVARGFDRVEPSSKMMWRTFVLLLMPALLLLVRVVRQLTAARRAVPVGGA